MHQSIEKQKQKEQMKRRDQIKKHKDIKIWNKMKTLSERWSITRWSSYKILRDKIGNGQNHDVWNKQILAMTGEEKGKWKAQKGLLVHCRSKHRRSGCRAHGRPPRRTQDTKERPGNETETRKKAISFTN